MIDPQRANMWFANKEMQRWIYLNFDQIINNLIVKYFRGKQLKDFVGNNDKTKIVVKLSTVGSGKEQQLCVHTSNICLCQVLL